MGGRRTDRVRALEQAEAHLASCARCQSMVAVMARTDEPLAVEKHGLAPWLAWLVPAAATAAVAVGLVWLAVPHQNSPSPAQTSAEVVSPGREAELSRDLTPQRKDEAAPRPPAPRAPRRPVAPLSHEGIDGALGHRGGTAKSRSTRQTDALESRQGRRRPLPSTRRTGRSSRQAAQRVETFAQPAARAPPAPPPPATAPPAAARRRHGGGRERPRQRRPVQTPRRRGPLVQRDPTPCGDRAAGAKRQRQSAGRYRGHARGRLRVADAGDSLAAVGERHSALDQPAARSGRQVFAGSVRSSRATRRPRKCAG